MSEQLDLRVNGNTAMPGGEYGLVTISGNGSVTSDLRCAALTCGGNGSVQGACSVRGGLRLSGNHRFDGDLRAADGSISGKANVDGALEITNTLRTNGVLTIQRELLAGSLEQEGVTELGGVLRVNRARIIGVLRCQEVEAESFYSRGMLEIAGLLNAERIDIEVNNENRVGSIGGSFVQVRKGKRPQLLRKEPQRLKVQTIEADEVLLELTQAGTVRGRNVVIGKDCIIGRVEYTGVLTVDPSARVEERVKPD